MADKWMVITNFAQIKYPGIYQEKSVVMLEKSEAAKIRQLIEKEGGELAEIPPRIKKLIEGQDYMGAVAHWCNKTDPRMSKIGIDEGDYRILIDDNE